MDIIKYKELKQENRTSLEVRDEHTAILTADLFDLYTGEKKLIPITINIDQLKDTILQFNKHVNSVLAEKASIEELMTDINTAIDELVTDINTASTERST